MGKLHEINLSPSKSQRWLHCPACVKYMNDYKLLDKYEFDYIVKAREEGTAAHKVAEKFLKEYLSEHKNRHDIALGEENDMVCYGKKYAQLVYEKFCELLNKSRYCRINVEMLIDCSEYAVNCMGTPDAFIITD